MYKYKRHIFRRTFKLKTWQCAESILTICASSEFIQSEKGNIIFRDLPIVKIENSFVKQNNWNIAKVSYLRIYSEFIQNRRKYENFRCAGSIFFFGDKFSFCLNSSRAFDV